MLLRAESDYRIQNFVSLSADAPNSFYSSRIFLAFSANSEVFMGLGSWQTAPGDDIIQFWNTDASFIATETKDNQVHFGRAGLVKDRGIIAWDIPSNRELFEGPSERTVDYFLPISTLTRLTFDTACLPGMIPHHYLEDTIEHSKVSWSFEDFESKDAYPLNIEQSYADSWQIGSISQIGQIPKAKPKQSCSEMPCSIFVPELFKPKGID
jgi:hypothetical protein